MKKQLVIITSIFFSHIVHTQTTKSLSKQLWENAQSCYSELTNALDEGEKIMNGEIIDDSKNGYLKVSGSAPPCGCTCSSTVGAYRQSNGTYTLLTEEKWGCSWTTKIASNRELASVFPENLGITTFIPKANIGLDNEYALFYLDIEIPRKGTDTKLTINPIPFGIYKKSNTVLSFEFSENTAKGYNTYTLLYRIKTITKTIENEQTLEFIADGQFGKISENDRKIIEKNIGQDDSQFKSYDELKEYISELKLIYDYYSLIEHETIILGWNREKGRFFIKEKGNHAKSKSFKEFLIENEYWAAVC